MAALGNIGKESKRPIVSRPTVYAWLKQISVVASITGGTAGEVAYLYQDGAPAQRVRIDPSGNCTIYDLEDGQFQLREVMIDAHAWKVEVSGASVTITPLSPGGGGGAGTTRGFGFFGS